MLKTVEGTGNTIEEAKANAFLQLGISELDEYKELEVVKTPTKKVLGLFGGSPAIVRVSVEVADEKKTKKESKTAKPEQKKEKKKAEAKAIPVQTDIKKELSLEVTNNYKETAEYIKSIVMALGMENCTVTEMSNDEEIYFELDCGDDYGIIIGKRGETLDALQYLARMIANKGKSSYKRVSVNVGNYRAKREETLRALARKTAVRAIKQDRNITLEPMNPYERRVIHTAVQEVEGATSHSVGLDLERRVVIGPVGGGKTTSSRRSYSKGNRRPKAEAYKAEVSADREPKSDLDGSFLYGKIESKTEE